MAASNNPFYVSPPDVMQSLMAFDQSYNAARKDADQEQIKAARIQAGQAIQSGADPKMILGKLYQFDPQGAAAYGNLLHQQATERLTGQQIVETGRHNVASEGQSAASLAQTAAHQKETEDLARKTFEEAQRQHEVTNLQPVKLGTRTSGEDVYGIRDPKSPSGYRIIDTKSLTGTPAPPNQNLTSGTITGVDVQDAPVLPVGGGGKAKSPGAAYLEGLNDPQYAQLVKGLAEYRINPTTLSTKGGHRERALGHAAEYSQANGDEVYDQVNYPMRANALSRFTSGPQGNTIRSLGVVVDHAATLRELGEALQNGNIQLFNKIAQGFAQQTGSAVPTNFDLAKNIVGAELIKALGVAGAGTEKERAELGQSISRASSPEQVNGVIDKVLSPLLGGQLVGLRRQFTTSTKLPESRFNEMLSPNALRFLDKGGTSTATAAVAPPKIGETRDGYRFKGGNPGDQTNWVKVTQ